MGGKRHWSVRFFPQENKFENETAAGHQGAWRKQKDFPAPKALKLSLHWAVELSATIGRCSTRRTSQDQNGKVRAGF